MKTNQSEEIQFSSSIYDSHTKPYFQRLVQHNRSINNLDKFLCIALPVVFFVLLAGFLIAARGIQGSQYQREQIVNVEELISSDLKIQEYQPRDFYWFSVSTKDLILNSDLDSLYKRDRKAYNIDRETHLRAILLTQLIHNVNSKGEVKVQMSPFDNDPSRKEKAIRKVMEMEKNYYEHHYQLSKYQHAQLPFCIVVPSYNNIKSRLYLRNLDSIFMQDYQNYRVVYIDDHSPERTGHYVSKYVDEKGIPSEKIKVIVNEVNKKALQNIYEGIHEHCKEGQIVALIDGDDSFNGRQVLKLYNALFHSKKLGMMYSNFLKITSNSRTQFGFGSQLHQEYFEKGYLRTYWPIIGTHLMAFYTDVFKQIKKQDLCYQNGTFYDYAYDRAIITPLLQLSYPRNYYLPEMVYEYRNDTGVNDGEADWIRVSNIIQGKPAYKNLQDFSFIDNHPIIRKGQQTVYSG